MKNIWLVVPCYNEEEVLPETSRQLKAVMQSMIDSGKISPESKIAFVNDGSKDDTWNIISALCADDGIFAGINLSQLDRDDVELACCTDCVGHRQAVVKVTVDEIGIVLLQTYHGASERSARGTYDREKIR